MLNKNYILKNIAGSAVVLPVGDAAKGFNGMINLNESAEFIWHCLEKDETRDEILKNLKSEYNAPEEVLAKDLDDFLSLLKEKNILE